MTHSFTIAFARAMAGRAAGPFTFCYLSGMGADPTAPAWFPWERLTRHLKGRAERDLAGLQSEHPGFCSHSFRPAGILPATANAALDFLLAPLVVRVGILADATITAAVEPAFSGLRRCCTTRLSNGWHAVRFHRSKCRPDEIRAYLPGRDSRATSGYVT